MLVRSVLLLAHPPKSGSDYSGSTDQRRLQCRGQAERVEVPGSPSARPGHLSTDVLPEVAKHRDLLAWDVVGHREPRAIAS